MPLYSASWIPASVSPGDPGVAIVNAEQLGAGNFSQQVAIARPYGTDAPIAITFAYAGTPAAVQYDIYAANEDLPSAYLKIGSTANVNGDRVDISMAAMNLRFVRVKEVTSPGVAATVKVFG